MRFVIDELFIVSVHCIAIFATHAFLVLVIEVDFIHFQIATCVTKLIWL